RPLTDDGKPHAILAAFLSDALHRLARPGELTFAGARNVGMRFLAHEDDRKLAILRVPIVELERQAADLGGNSRSDIERHRRQVDDCYRYLLIAKADEITEKTGQRTGSCPYLRLEEKIIAHVVHSTLEAHEKAIELTVKIALLLAIVGPLHHLAVLVAHCRQ